MAGWLDELGSSVKKQMGKVKDAVDPTKAGTKTQLDPKDMQKQAKKFQNAPGDTGALARAIEERKKGLSSIK